MMKQEYLFSATTASFYLAELMQNYMDEGSIPEDATPIDHAAFVEFSGEPPAGKIRGSNKKGHPAWVDAPPPTRESLIAYAEQQKQIFAGEAEKNITMLERKVRLGMAEDGEKDLLTEWEIYSIKIADIDTSLAPDIDWPQKP
ncbi:tail fiber assembly protein [Providencia sp. wls1922]|uniref:tail fiber assembly protein n=1 Tax=Providencia sp. wls1922 TaxID=2675152 RepID=UPI0012B5B6BB|nr:tail fiber assembly protein [Providencia sp. wls1922]MTC44224.1 tail fiber assembly protein [Providencia sp. wls1922]